MEWWKGFFDADYARLWSESTPLARTEQEAEGSALLTDLLRRRFHSLQQRHESWVSFSQEVAIKPWLGGQADASQQIRKARIRS